ncbi:MAG: hypothetical protein AB7N80_13550 [Bdellovibrionales bacterium]
MTWIKMTLSFLLSLTTVNAWAIGSSVRGGGTPYKMDEASLSLMIEGGLLKKAMLDYLKTLRIAEITDRQVQSTFRRILKTGLLQKDISTLNNYELSANCTSDLGPEVAAATIFGSRETDGKLAVNLGGKICFDLNKLLKLYQGSALSQEQLLIRLAALAFHEHVHHFQIDDVRLNEENEREADRLGAYVQLTARAAQNPSLKWDPVAALKEAQTVEFKRWYAGLQADLRDDYTVTEGSIAVQSHFEAFQGLSPQKQHHLMEAYRQWRALASPKSVEHLTPYDAVQIRDLIRHEGPFAFERSFGWRTLAMTSRLDRFHVIVAGILMIDPSGLRQYRGEVSVLFWDPVTGVHFRSERQVSGSLTWQRLSPDLGFDYGWIALPPNVSVDQVWSEIGLRFQVKPDFKQPSKEEYALDLSTDLFEGPEKLKTVSLPLVSLSSSLEAGEHFAQSASRILTHTKGRITSEVDLARELRDFVRAQVADNDCDSLLLGPHSSTDAQSTKTIEGL